jgi:hypothetical protein
VAARAFWRLRFGVPIRRPSRVLYAYYPELQAIDTKRPSREPGSFDVLLLGASTLNRNWGHVEAALREQLAYTGHRNVRIFNLARAGHTSLDSRLKYAAVGEARFALVVVYDGINEAFLNNAPPEIFREDYSHHSWYRFVNALAPYHGATSFALPYTLRYLAVALPYALTKDRYVQRDVRQEWTRYGGVPRSAPSFRRNLAAILEMAARRGDRVLLMTFAIHVPENYSAEAFKAKRLDYGLHLSPLEIWGVKEHVLATVAVDNEIVRSLAAQHDGVLFVDQAKLMSAEPRYFNDPCHFTLAGSSKFVENLLTALPPDLAAATPGRD